VHTNGIFLNRIETTQVISHHLKI